MNFQIIAIIFFMVLLIIFMSKMHNKFDVDEKIENTVGTVVAMEELFFEKIRAGAVGMRIASVHSQFDIMFIKSFFQSEQIPHFLNLKTFQD